MIYIHHVIRDPRLRSAKDVNVLALNIIHIYFRLKTVDAPLIHADGKIISHSSLSIFLRVEGFDPYLGACEYSHVDSYAFQFLNSLQIDVHCRSKVRRVGGHPV